MSDREAQTTPLVQIILRELPDGRVEVAIMQRGPQSTPFNLARLFLASLGQIADVRGLLAGLLRGSQMTTEAIDVGQKPSPQAAYEDVSQCGGAELDAIAQRFGLVNARGRGDERTEDDRDQVRSAIKSSCRGQA